MFTFRSMRAWERGHNIVVMTSDNPGSRLIEVVWEWDKQHINKIQEQPMNQISLIKRPTVQHCISANTKPHHQHWDDRRIGTAISCMVGDTWQTAMSKTPVAVRDSRQNQTQGPWPEIPSAITTVLQLLGNQWTPLVCWFDFYHFK